MQSTMGSFHGGLRMRLNPCRRSRILVGGLASLLSMSLAACSSSSDPLVEGHSRLRASLSASNAAGEADSAKALKVKAQETKEVVVHLNRVTAHAASSGWVTLSDAPLEVDLLKLQEKSADLGVANLPQGKVTQLRLYVDSSADNHVVLSDGSSIPLKVPSGSQSGIKVKGPFELSSCEETQLTLELDVAHSVKVHSTGSGSGGEYILRPVIRVAKQEQESVKCVAPSGSDGGSSDDDQEEDDSWEDGGAGSPCDSASDCYSGTCGDAHTCAAGTPGSSCHATADCSSGVCGEDGQCESSAAQPTGGTCESASQCNSGACVSGTCAVGGQGAPCQFYTDCDNGLTCDQGYCVPALN